MEEIAEIKNARIEKKNGAPGESVMVDIQTNGEDDAELYSTAGVMGIPHDGAIGKKSDVRGLRIISGVHDYRLNISIDKGEVLLYSYDEAGVLLSTAKCNAAGEFVINDGIRFAARKDDLIQSLPVDDTAFWAWVVNVSAFINGLAPGTIPVVPQSLTGKIIEGSDKVLLP